MALQQLQQYAAENGHSDVAEPISVDDILRRLADGDVSKLGLPPSSLLSVFRLPQSRLRELWLKALRRAFAAAEDEIGRGRDVIITSHLCYFHHKYRDFVAVAQLDAFKRLAKRRVEKVITLIDDVFDTYARLTGPGQTFNPPRDLETPYIDGLRTLSWRASELMLSSGLATMLGARHFVFATKHPVSALHKLLYSARPCLYISHPITEVRRLRAHKKFVEADALVGGISETVEDLATDFVVLEPTTIDELRFVDFVRNRAPISGKLTDRWPFHVEGRETCWSKPDTPRTRYHFPVGWDADDRGEVDGSRPAVREFIESIERQISARDHWLVEQSDFLVCLRPIFEGHASGGVRNELEHIKTLRAFRSKKPDRAFVVSPRGDHAAFPCRQLADEILKTRFDHGQIVADSGADFLRLQEHLRELTRPDETIQKILASESVALHRLLNRFSCSIASDAGVMDGENTSARDAVAEAILVEITEKSEPYLAGLQELLTIHENVDSMLREIRSTYPLSEVTS